MSYTLTFEDQPAYLHVRVIGKQLKENVVEYLSEIYAVCVERKRTIVLIEEYLEGPSLSPSEIYDVVTRATSIALPAGWKIAFVDTNPDHDSEGMKLAETVATRRAVNIRAFSTVASAREWLLDESKTETSRARGA